MKKFVSGRGLGIAAIAALILPFAPAALAEATPVPVQVERVNVSSAEAQANAHTTVPNISDDGRFVSVGSDASNLVAGDTNGTQDEFVRDRVAGTTERISVSSNEVQANGWSGMGQISGNGLFVAFASDATNIVPNDTNGQRDVFLRDRVAGTTQRIALAVDHPYVSYDGRFVAWDTCIGGWYFEIPHCAVYLIDRDTNTVERIDVSSAEEPSGGSSMVSRMSRDGRYVSFTSDAANLVPGVHNGLGQMFLRDRQSGTTELISMSSAGVVGNGVSSDASMTPDGRLVTFTSYADNLVPGDTNGDGDPGGFPGSRPGADVFLRDRVAGTTEIISVSSAETQGDDWAGRGVITADGMLVAFHSDATNLIPGGVHAGPYGQIRQVYLRDRSTGTTDLVSRTASGTQANDYAGYPTITPNGRYISFVSFATNLVSGDTNGQFDAFVLRLDNPTPYVATVVATADTYVNKSAPTTSYGFSSSMAAGSAGSYLSYLRFNVPAAPAGRQLVAATLRLHSTNSSFAGSTDALEVRQASIYWNEATTTWNNRPTTGPAHLGDLGPVPANAYGTATLDTTKIGPGTPLNLVVNSAGDSAWFWSRSYARTAYRPTLELIYR